MPKITTTDNTCFYCGSQALYISYNSKKFRCVEKISQCPAISKKQEKARQQNISVEKRLRHMKIMSKKGHAKLKELHKDKKWVSKKSNKISTAVKKRGGHIGKNNPMYGKKHSNITIQKLSTRAKNRNPLCYVKATKTKINKGIAIPKEQKTSWDLYREQVKNYTVKNWKYYQHLINPKNFKRGSEYELDHKFSITEGFRQGVSPKIIGHCKNLKLIPKNVNRSKRINCSITLKKLQEIL